MVVLYRGYIKLVSTLLFALLSPILFQAENSYAQVSAEVDFQEPRQIWERFLLHQLPELVSSHPELLKVAAQYMVDRRITGLRAGLGAEYHSANPWAPNDGLTQRQSDKFLTFFNPIDSTLRQAGYTAQIERVVDRIVTRAEPYASSPSAYAEWAKRMNADLYSLTHRHFAVWSVINEPYNTSPPTNVDDDMVHWAKLTKRAFRDAGMPTAIEIADSINVVAFLNMLNEWLRHRRTLTEDVDYFSTHPYGNQWSQDEHYERFARAGVLTSKSTAMTEDAPQTFVDLIRALKFGLVSRVNFYGDGPVPNYENTAVNLGRRPNTEQRHHGFVAMAQAMPSGARFYASRDSNESSALSVFTQTPSGTTNAILVPRNSSDVTVEVRGLPAGRYAGTKVRTNGLPQHDGFHTIGSGGSISVRAPGNGVYTLRQVLGNVAPMVTQAVASPRVIRPGQTTQLTMQTFDLNRDQLSVEWTVQQQPAGASPAQIISPNSLNTAITLRSVGKWIIRACARDAQFENCKDTLITVDSDGNVAAHLWEIFIVAPDSISVVEKPSSGPAEFHLWGDAVDEEGDGISYSFRAAQEPFPGAALIENVGNPQRPRVRINTPGIYQFEGTATARGGSSSLRTRVIRVIDAGTQPPRVSNFRTRRISKNSIELLAEISEPEGDHVRYEFCMVGHPPTAHEYVEIQNPSGILQPSSGATTVRTVVDHLSHPGDYVFQLNAIDRSHVATPQVSYRHNVLHNSFATAALADFNDGLASYSSRSGLPITRNGRLEINDTVELTFPYQFRDPSFQVEAIGGRPLYSEIGALVLAPTNDFKAWNQGDVRWVYARQHPNAVELKIKDLRTGAVHHAGNFPILPADSLILRLEERSGVLTIFLNGNPAETMHGLPTGTGHVIARFSLPSNLPPDHTLKIESMFMHEGSKAVDVFSDKDGIGIALMDGLANPGFDLNRYVLSVNDANVPGPLLWNYLQGLPRERYDIQGDARTLLILRFLFPFQAGTTIGSYYDGNADRVVVPGR